MLVEAIEAAKANLIQRKIFREGVFIVPGMTFLSLPLCRALPVASCSGITVFSAEAFCLYSFLFEFFLHNAVVPREDNIVRADWSWLNKFQEAKINQHENDRSFFVLPYRLKRNYQSH